jgi:hypothetical protein
MKLASQLFFILALKMGNPENNNEPLKPPSACPRLRLSVARSMIPIKSMDSSILCYYWL